MTFIVILIALLIERFFDWSHLRHWNWYTALQNKLMQRFPSLSPYLILAASIIPLLLIVAIIQYSLEGVLYGFAELLFQLFVLLYCFGPKNLWADTFACINALVQGDASHANEKLKNSFGNDDASYSQSVRRHFLNDIFIEANRRVFAIIFWFAVLGPIGALLYRAVTLSFPEVNQQPATSPALVNSARSVEAVLDWVPVRILTILFALGGHCAKVLSCWSSKAALGLSSNQGLLTECGVAALGIDDGANVPADGHSEKSAISLLDRAFVITLMVIAVLVIFT